MKDNLCYVLAFGCFTLLCNCSKEEAQQDLQQIDLAAESASDGLPHLCTELHSNHARAFGSRNAFWNKSLLRVRFLEGSNYVQEKVKQYAQEWSRHANITFEFVDSEPSDIRISFDSESGSWSYVGQNNRYISSQRATMNFGWFDSRTSEAEFRRTTLHEFGHALGLSHEHQHPEVNIDWNRDAVYRYYERTQDWSSRDVDNNIFRKYSTATSNFSNYDPSSIMHYYIPRSLVDGVWYPTSNRTLSGTDISFIREMYPGLGEEDQSCTCPESLVTIACQDFEQLTQSTFENDAHWTRWSADAGNAELQTYTWGKVIKMQYNESDNPDVVYHPITLDRGVHRISWDMYVGENNSAYFNMQKQEEIGREFGAQFYFDQDLSGRVQINGRDLPFTYAQNQWLEVAIEIDVENNLASLQLDSEEIANWPLTWSARSEQGSRQIAGINFYAVDSESRFWLDDFCIAELQSGSSALATAWSQLPSSASRGLKD